MDISSIKKLPEEFKDLIKVAAENARAGWAGRLALIEIILLAALNPVIASTILKQFTDAPLPKHYATFWGAAVAIIFVIAVIVYIRAEKSRRPSRIFGEHSPIKGLLPFGKTDREIFKQLQRGTELTECYQAVADHGFRFGVLSGESGAGKTSFLQAGLWPALLDQHRCVSVKFTDLDPVAAIRQAIIEQKIGIPETTPADAPLSTLLADVAQSDAKPLVLLLDQFEQFFVHFKRESRRRPFIRELNEWYRNGRGLPIKILICVRGDFLDHLSELQEAMGYSLGPQQKFRLKKFRPEQAAAVFRVIAETEKLDCDESFIKELTEQELAGADDGLISPVDIQILAWMIAGQAGQGAHAFNRTTFQKLGGVEGLLERFLTRALDARETPARRQAATKVLLALTDLDRNARAGALTLDELRQKLGDALADAELKEAVEWLSRGDVRLIAPVKLEEVDGYELAHERLIPALRRTAGKELSEADRASLLLDRRFNEWTGNDRDRRYRLTWRELRSIKKQTPFMQCEPNRSGKESLIAASWRQIRFRFILASLPVLLGIAFASVWYSQWGYLQQIKWDVATYSDEITESEALSQITRAYAMMGDFPKAFQVAEKIDNNEDSKATALQSIAEAYARLGEKEKATQLLNQAHSLAEKFVYESSKARAFQSIAEVYATLGEKEKDFQLISKALSLAEKIGDESSKARALRVTTEAYARLGEKEKAAQLLNQALSLAEKVDYEEGRARALQAIAEVYARLGEKEKATQLLNQAFSLAEKISDETDKLRVMAEVYARLGEKEKAAQLLSYAISVAEKFYYSVAVKVGDEGYKARALQTIAQAYAKLGEKEKAAQLLSQALSYAEKFGNEYSKASTIQSIAKAYARLGEKEKAAQLLSQTLSLAEKLDNESYKAIYLQAIAEDSAKLGDFRLARVSARKMPSKAGEAKTLALILEIWAKSKNPRLADEVSKDEE